MPPDKTLTPSDNELDAILCNQWPAFASQATLVRIWVRQAMRDAVAVFGDATPQPTQAQAGAVPPIKWPKARDVGRIGDMSPIANLRVGFDSDNDVFVSVWDERGGGSVEFCNPGGGGGGQSSKTRMALIALMVAMEEDNAEKPSRDWWALRMGGIKGGQHGTDT